MKLNNSKNYNIAYYIIKKIINSKLKIMQEYKKKEINLIH